MTAAVDVRTQCPLVMTAGDATLLVDASAGIPRVLYWGKAVQLSEADLAAIGSLTAGQWTVDGVQRVVTSSVLPEQSAGWMGTPGLEGHRNGTRFSTRFDATGANSGTGADGEQFLDLHAVDEVAELGLHTRIEMLPSGLVRLSARLANLAAQTDAPHIDYTLEALRIALPLPAEATEILDFAGRHLRERSPQRHPFVVGTHLREGRRGRSGSDSTVLLAAGTSGFTFGTGEVWAVHTAWSGNHATFAELGLTGTRLIGGGELLLPGEIVLGPGESYQSPFIYAAYGEGLDAVASAFHTHLRSRASHPHSPRPVVLNTWEAVYFDQNLSSLTQLAEVGARVGVERFVLDDGWFRNRHSDRAGLGDWQVDTTVWPEGLGPLVRNVRALGMQFGLWFEPEMINEDSELARAHPDWILAPGERLPLRARHQQVLNLTIPAAFDSVLESMSRLIEEYGIDYVKWDHNRDLVEAGDRSTGAPRVHEQTRAAYRLMDELRLRHPGLEIESCASGGGRVDLGVLEYTDRVWASDCIDALERQHIQRWTGLLLPPELIGSHVGAPTAHTTHRTHSLAFRAATALFGHFGIEWDIRSATEEELVELAAWVALYKAERGLIHSGRTVHSDYPDESYWCHGIVSQERDQALFAFVAMSTSAASQPGRIRIRGLEDDATYRIEPIELSTSALVVKASGPPAWLAAHTAVTGRTLRTVGVQAATLYPEQALLVRILRVDEG